MPLKVKLEELVIAPAVVAYGTRPERKPETTRSVVEAVPEMVRAVVEAKGSVCATPTVETSAPVFNIEKSVEVA